jgi:hypothetical protein
MPTDKDILATGAFDGNIKVWDISKMKCLNQFSKKNKVKFG